MTTSDFVAVLAKRAEVRIQRRPADPRGISVNDRVCSCGEVLPWPSEAAVVAHRKHVAAELVNADRFRLAWLSAYRGRAEARYDADVWRRLAGNKPKGVSDE